MTYLLRDLQRITEDYSNHPRGTLSILGTELLPDIPLKLKEIISNYRPPTTQEDLIILHSLDPSGKLLSTAFGTDDPEMIKILQKIIALPETSLTHLYHKLKYALEYNYYPLAIDLYRKISQEGRVPRSTVFKILDLAQKQGYQNTVSELIEKKDYYVYEWLLVKAVDDLDWVSINRLRKFLSNMIFEDVIMTRVKELLKRDDYATVKKLLERFDQSTLLGSDIAILIEQRKRGMF